MRCIRCRRRLIRNAELMYRGTQIIRVAWLCPCHPTLKPVYTFEKAKEDAR